MSRCWRGVRLVAAVGLIAAAAGCEGATPSARPGAAALAPVALLSGAGADLAGFARADVPRPFVFPADHGPHPGFRTEWWYFTGVLTGRAAGAPADAPARRFGYQLTIFRQALAATRAPRASAWATRDVYMAHLAIADAAAGADAGGFRALERFARDGLGLAGARAEPFAVWVGDWRISGPPAGALFPAHLQATGADTAVDLEVGAGRGPIAQGEGGLSRKGAQAGNASYYYSCTRLPTRGRLVAGGRAYEVQGESWLDREWSTSALEPGVVGWDWLGAHLADGRDLMVYRLRRRDGSAAPESRATVIAPAGDTRLYAPDAFTLAPEGTWRSPNTGAVYPAAFRLRIPTAGVDLLVRPLRADQELVLSVRYWEGAVDLLRAGADAAAGSGYLELTGYGPPGAP